MTDPQDTMRSVRRGVALAVLVIGWVFIAWQNHFHITAPLVFVCLGYLAVIATVYNLWRTGASVVDPSDEDTDSTWAQPVGALGELEREKRTLLKAIKEAEFDHQMGKLSQRDADEMIRSYRARAIEVIKEIDRLGAGGAGAGGSVRDQILREVRARVELDAKAARKADARATKADPKRAAKVERAEAVQPAAAEAAAAKPSAAAEGGAAASSAPAAAADSASAAGEPPARPRDEELDADSTTAIEPRRDDRADDRAKEATP